jgi:hypothetical protein
MSRARNALPSQRRGVIGASGPPDASKRARLGPQPPDCKRAGLAPSAAQRGSRGSRCVIGQFAAGGIRVRRQFTFGKWMTRGNTSAFLCIRCRRHAPVASVPRVTGAFLLEGKCARRLIIGWHCHAFGHPRRRLRLHPIQSFETGLKFVHWLNRAIGPFGLYFPMLAIFKNHRKYRSSRRHVFTHPHMMARRE